MTHQDAYELIPDWSLGLLDEVTEARLATHAAGCEECQRAQREAMQTLHAVALAVPQVAPPPSLRARVLTTALSEPQDRAVPMPAQAAQAPVAPSPVPSGRSWLLPVAASLIAVLGLGAWLMTSAQLRESEALVASLRPVIQETQAEAAALRAREEQAASERRTVEAVLSAGDLTQVVLDGQPPTVGARGRAFLSARGLVFTAEGLPTLAAAQIYQLWLIVDSQPVSAGTFSQDTGGTGRLVVPLPSQGAPAALAVTVEPAGGVPAPTGPKVLVGVPSN